MPTIALLHLEIGLFRKSWKTLQLYLDDKVELIPLDEQELKKKLSVLVEKGKTMKSENENFIFLKSQTYSKREEYRCKFESIVTAQHSVSPVDILRINELKIKKKENCTKMKDSWKEIRTLTAKKMSWIRRL